MTIEEFNLIHPTPNPKPIDSVVEDWVVEKEIDNFLYTVADQGVLVVDILANPDFTNEGITNELLEGFKKLMHDKADTLDKVRNLLIQKGQESPKTLLGLLNKIQGQLGENEFVRHTGKIAELAHSGSQEAWDVVVHHAHGDQFVQIKVYEDAHKVIAAMQRDLAKVAAGKIHYGTHLVKQLDYAVNDDIYDQVKHLQAQHHIHAHVLKIGAPRAHMRSLLEHSADRATDATMTHFFNDLFHGAVLSGSLIAATNAFLVWKGAKERQAAIVDTFYSTSITVGGLSSALATKSILISKLHVALGAIAGPVGVIGLIGVGMSSREIMRRFANRRFLIQRLAAENNSLENTCARLEAA